MDTRKVTLLAALVILLVALVSLAEGGECCASHHYPPGEKTSNKVMWCDRYCCNLGNRFGCCHNITQQAKAHDRISFCADFFLTNWWVTVLVALAVFGFIVAVHVVCSVVLGVVVLSKAHQTSAVTIIPPNYSAVQSSTWTVPTTLKSPQNKLALK